MNQLKYKLVPQGAAEGRVPINLAYIDKKDVLVFFNRRGEDEIVIDVKKLKE